MAPLTIFAVDPGASGCLVKYVPKTGFLQVIPMPETDMDIVYALGGWFANAIDPHWCVCYLEQVGGFTGGPSPGSAMFKFGWNASAAAWLAMAYGVPLKMITPQKWQKLLSLGSGGKGPAARREWKNKLKAMAQRLHPELVVTLKTADALLILEAAKILEK